MNKVLHLRSSSGFYGPERQILQLVKPMRQEGFEIEILVLYRRNGTMPLIHPLVERAKRNALKAEQLDDTAKFSPGAILNIAERLRGGHFSLIHTHGYKTDFFGGLAAKLAGVRGVATVHLHTETSCRLRLYKIIDLFALRFFPKVIAVSEHLRQELISRGLSKEKVVTIHAAIDLEAFLGGVPHNDRNLRDILNIGNDQHVISIVGRLTPQKGHGYFLKGAKRILEALPQTRFLVIGDGPLRMELEKLAISSGIDRAVSFLGYQEDIAAFMRVSDVVAMPSVKEGLPVVLLEALALARPVVGTQVGGIPEVIEHGKTGFLVPPKDSEGLAEAIIWALKNPDEAARLGERGRELISREFNVETMARKTAAVYTEVLSGLG
jgi:glycosyltransferase involved in cell wall biosynthesis